MCLYCTGRVLHRHFDTLIILPTNKCVNQQIKIKTSFLTHSTSTLN